MSHASAEGRCRNYAAVLAAWAAPDPETEGDEEVGATGEEHPAASEAVERLLRGAVTDAGSADWRLAVSALETLCWAASGEASVAAVGEIPYRGDDYLNIIQQWPITVRSELCGAVVNAVKGSRPEVRLTALFLLSEQRLPAVFALQFSQCVEAVVACVRDAAASPDSPAQVLLSYGIGALSRLVEQNPAQGRAHEALLGVVLPTVVDAGILRCKGRTHDAAVGFLCRGLLAVKDLSSVASFVKGRTRDVMDYLNVLLSPTSEDATSDESPELLGAAVATVGAVWRAWVSLLPATDLPPLLKSGSTGPQSAGYLLKSVEKLFGFRGIMRETARLEACLCWRSIANSIVTIDAWWNKEKKIVKLLLRCITHVLDTEKQSAEIVSTIGECLEILLSNAWPDVDGILDLSLGSGPTACARSTLTSSLISDEMLKLADITTSCDTADKFLAGIPLRVRIAKFAISVGCLHCSFYKHKKGTEIVSSFSFRVESQLGVPAFGYDTLFSVFGSTVAATVQLSAAYRMVAACRSCAGPDVEHDSSGSDLLTHVGESIVLVFQRAIVAVGQGLVLCGGDQTKLGVVVVKPALGGAAHLQPHSLESSGCATVLRNHAGSCEIRHEDTSIGSHIIYTMDSDGYEHPVLTSATPSVVETVDTIFRTIVKIFELFWLSEFGDQLKPLRGYLVESFWWLLHKLSAYDIVPNPVDEEVLFKAVDNLKLSPRRGFSDGGDEESSDDDENDDHHVRDVPHVMLGMAMLLTIAHACRYTESTDGPGARTFNKSTSVLCSAVRRSMKSISESRTLPGAFRWLPWLTRRLVLEPPAANREFASIVSVDDNQRDLSKHRKRVLLYSRPHHERLDMDTGLRVVGIFATAAAFELSKMPVAETTVGSGVSSGELDMLVGNMIAGLLNLVAVPLYVLSHRLVSFPSFLLMSSDNPNTSTSDDSFTIPWVKLVETILQYDDVYISDLLELMHELTRVEADVVFSRASCVTTLIEGIRLGCKLLSALLNCVSKHLATCRNLPVRCALLRQLRQSVICLFSSRVLTAWVLPMMQMAFSPAHSLTDYTECTVNFFDPVLVQYFSSFIAAIDGSGYSISVRAKIESDSEEQPISPDNNAYCWPALSNLVYSIRQVYNGVLMFMKLLNTLPHDQMKGQIGKRCLDAVYHFSLLVTVQLARFTRDSTVAVSTELTKELAIFKSQFIRTELTVKSELAYSSIAELLRELGEKLPADSHDRGIQEQQLYFKASGTKRSYLNINSCPQPGPSTPKKTKPNVSLMNEAIEFLAVATESGPSKTGRPRQWGGIPCLYSGVDRDNMLSQSQDRLSASQTIDCTPGALASETAQAIPTPFGAEEVKKPTACMHCAVHKMYTVLASLSHISKTTAPRTEDSTCSCRTNNATIESLLAKVRGSSQRCHCNSDVLFSAAAVVAMDEVSAAAEGLRAALAAEAVVQSEVECALDPQTSSSYY